MKLRKRTVIALMLAIPLAGIALVAAYYFCRVRHDKDELADIIATLDRDEPDWRAENLNLRREPVADAENSAPVIRAIHARLPKKWLDIGPEDSVEGLPPGKVLTPKQRRALQARLQKVAEILPEARALVNRPHGRFPIAIIRGHFNPFFPHVQDVGAVAALLHQDIFGLVDGGALNDALVSCRAGVNVARALDAEPSVVSQQVRSGCLRSFVEGMQHILATGNVDASQLGLLQAALQDADRQDVSETVLRSERALAHQEFTKLEDGTINAASVVNYGRPPGSSNFFGDLVSEVALATSVHASHVWTLCQFKAIMEAENLPERERRARFAAIDRESVAASPTVAKWFPILAFRSPKSFRADRARLRCAIAALAVERYRLQHGQWPADLAALTPALLATIPVDPFSGAALRYRKTANGVVVFSVGPNAAHTGDFFDRPPPPDATAPPKEDANYEFRLWDRAGG